jgi:hypothetical protein
MNETPTASLLVRLYELCTAKPKDEGTNRVVAGHTFEDETAQQIYYFARNSGLEANPPRTTLNLPTLSGNAHQFDSSFQHGGEMFVVECKNTREAAKEYLYTFNAKIMDYVDAIKPGQNLAFHGFFLSTVPVAESAWRYSLAYGIRIVDPLSPPPEYVLEKYPDDSITVAFKNILEKMLELGQSYDAGENAPKILQEYRFLCSRWKDVSQ